MKTRKFFYLFAAIILVGFIGYATAASNISSPANEAAIRAQASHVGQLEADFAVKRAHLGEQIRTVLTPDQITNLKELAAEIDSRVDGVIERINNNIVGPLR